MKTKPLYIMISDGGDGSAYPRFTFNTALVEKLQTAFDAGTMDYENGIACDGDGFHYETLTVPEECTAESLGIKSRMIDDTYADKFFTDEE